MIKIISFFLAGIFFSTANAAGVGGVVLSGSVNPFCLPNTSTVSGFFNSTSIVSISGVPASGSTPSYIQNTDGVNFYVTTITNSNGVPVSCPIIYSTQQ